jgi:NAD-dependent deacetylase
MLDAIVTSRERLLVLTGAGVSTASGIPTFRGNDPNAVWANNVTALATLQHFRADPVHSWKWYRERFAGFASAKPNAAHTALARLGAWQRARGGEFLLVTQNIDTLHDQVSTTDLVKVHGSSDRARCASDRCALASTRTVPMDELDFAAFDRDPRTEWIPRCARCGHFMRPHVLWFDEFYDSHVDYEWQRAVEFMRDPGLALVAGTSFSVGITSFLDDCVSSTGTPMFVVDPSERTSSACAHAEHVRGNAEDVLPLVAARLPARERAP